MNAPTIVCELGSEQRAFQQQAGGSGGSEGEVPGACEVSVTEGNEVIAHCHSSESVALGKPLHFPGSFHSEAERFAGFQSQNILIVKCLMFSHYFDRVWILGVIFQSHLQKADSVSSQGKLLSGKHPSNEFPVQGHILGSGLDFPVLCDI